MNYSSKESSTLVAQIKNCAKRERHSEGVRLYASIVEQGWLTKDVYVGNSLINMFAKYGALSLAKQVFDQLPVCDVVSWTSLMGGYSEHGYDVNALKAFGQMQQEGLFPNRLTFLCILKACGNIGAIRKGKEVHSKIVAVGSWCKNVVLGTALVGMYAKCGAIMQAHRALYELSTRNVVTWNTLIAGCIDHGDAEEALNLIECMQHDGVAPNGVTFASILKACSRLVKLNRGREIHADIIRENLLGTDCVLDTALVHMYARCGALSEAHAVIDNLCIRSTTSWTALIEGYVEQDQGKKALLCFQQMLWERHKPDKPAFLCILKACGSIKDIDRTREIHAEISRHKNLRKDSVIGTAIVDTYAKCGSLDFAQEMFDKLPVQNVVSWTALIAGYCHNEHAAEALRCYRQMLLCDIAPNEVTFTCILKACSTLQALDEGKEIHREVLREGLLHKSAVLGTALVDMYAKCGALGKAWQVFENLPVRNVICWTALITGYCRSGQISKSLSCFQMMKNEGLTVDASIYICILKACRDEGDIDIGRQIHTDAIRDGVLANNCIAGNMLVDIYAKCGAMTKAQEVFDALPIWDVVSWTVLISGYINHGQCGEAFRCFEQMQQKGFPPDESTFACILKACGCTGDVEKGSQIHTKLVVEGLLENDEVLGAALVDMYAKCGKLSKAQQTLDEIPIQSTFSWTALISGYVQYGYNEEALVCFTQMQCKGFSADAATYLCTLKACSGIGSVIQGKEIHSGIVREGILANNFEIGIALLDMYVKCGSLEVAQQVFDELPFRSTITWNALITGYAQNGKHNAVFNSFKKMVQQRISPDSVTFTVVLKICCSLGLMDEGEKYFKVMTETFRILPTLEHYACMVGLFGHAGYFHKAISIIRKMPSLKYLPAWCSLLDACLKWGNVKLGKLVFERVCQLDKMAAVAYIRMKHIYAITGNQ